MGGLSSDVIFPLTALLLAVRGTISRDVPWKRASGAVLAVLPLLVPLVAWLLGSDRASIPSAIGDYGPAIAGAYLFAWAFMSRDPLWARLASAAIGAAAFLPGLLALVPGVAAMVGLR